MAASNQATPKPERPARIQCQNRHRLDDGTMRRCIRDGVACWVTGSFGREGKNLCNRCITEIRAVGWKVRYQLEGDNPPPLEMVQGE